MYALSINTVTDSPYADRVGSERKESIKKLIKELSRDAEHKKTAPKESDAESCKTTASSNEVPAFTRAKSCTMRLFRTVTLISELT